MITQQSLVENTGGKKISEKGQMHPEIYKQTGQVGPSAPIGVQSTCSWDSCVRLGEV